MILHIPLLCSASPIAAWYEILKTGDDTGTSHLYGFAPPRRVSLLLDAAVV